jgi:hypothetical protein
MLTPYVLSTLKKGLDTPSERQYPQIRNIVLR